MKTSNPTTFIEAISRPCACSWSAVWLHCLYSYSGLDTQHFSFLQWRGDESRYPFLKYLTLHKQQKNPKSYTFPSLAWTLNSDVMFGRGVEVSLSLPMAHSRIFYDVRPRMIWHEVTLHSFLLHGRRLKLDKRIKINSSVRLLNVITLTGTSNELRGNRDWRRGMPQLLVRGLLSPGF
jgi:hypothetical protein